MCAEGDVRAERNEVTRNERDCTVGAAAAAAASLTRCYSDDQIKKYEVAVACGTCGEWRGALRVVVGKPEGKRPLGRPRRRWEDNINIHFKKIVWEGVDWIDLARETDTWLAVLDAVMNLQFP
jgi:hypothetical protein